ncbi:hypothetical protein [Mycobacterium sherrisii]|uniref:Restriction endonuclease n=1 Tax=Mycobacterium sherrisii TaxID=243061 RepID=A0A1E3SV87_9MYCO|nr:hypothetical protein [Mycobacterium sherrisii]MCV7031989.1 hypothetical protein [Mycobacterium sherrisii]ODR06075.1 hypothetical protein BHQ21_12635 [Mycobacterium sherrisii]ORW76743.1 hypothetical protein AWC25_11440 [Mycobacterium sherrisii]
MASFDDRERRAAELAAYQALWNLWRCPSRSAPTTENWKTACRMLQTYYTVTKARQDRAACEMRIHYLQVVEPLPQLADFVPPPHYYGVADAQHQLAQVRHQYQLARLRHPVRDQQRRKELETTKALYTAMQLAEARERAAETTRRREWQRSRWPKDVVLDREIYDLDGIAAQVERQNANIASRVAALRQLLRAGLGWLAGDVTIPRGAAHNADVAGRVETALAAIPLPPNIVPAVTVSYSQPRRQLTVEYQLPGADVVPKVKAYRHVKARDTVVATARPAGQVKALYASIIAQLTVLALATAFAVDDTRCFDVVIFDGVIETIDPSTGESQRPCLVSVRADAGGFAALDLSSSDPFVILQRLSARMSPNPTECVPVRSLAQ